jgi:hypothetical protein
MVAIQAFDVNDTVKDPQAGLVTVAPRIFPFQGKSHHFAK